MPDRAANAHRQRLLKAGRLHWMHWAVVSLSLVLTLGAWYVAQNQVAENTALQFQREAERAAELIIERMQKYEDALWAGVGVYRVKRNQVDRAEWRRFVDAMDMDTKYPGINGIGVIYQVQPDELAGFLADQQRAQPRFDIHPAHSQSEYLPITYIEPLSINRQAQGLDMAHEQNRYAAAKRARDTGTAQITAPIVLVQDAEKTPGFLFYAPFYDGGPYDSIEQRRANFAGMVYAPFVVNKLMAGTLDKEKRHVGIRLSDGDQVLYDELNRREDDFDPHPMFRQVMDFPLYGRTWHMDIWSTLSFRDITASAQPITILIGGLLIDLLLLLLFLALARANRNAVAYADSMNEALQKKAANLERSNADLEQFAYVASHDLQEPLRMVGNFTQLLQARYEGQLDAKADQYINFAVDGVKRMQQLLNDLLQYSRLSADGPPREKVDTAVACRHALANLAEAMTEAGAEVTVGDMPVVRGDNSQLTRVFQNLIGNAIKFRDPQRPPRVAVSAVDQGDNWQFRVTDNGIGIEPQYQGQIFVMFQRLHSQHEYPGTGVGLAVCKKIIIQHGGDIEVESVPGQGTTFCFTLPKLTADD